MKFSENLKKLRKRRGLTQTELAEAIGISTGAISKYERGDDTPTFDNLMKLTEFLEVSLDDLIVKDVEKDALTGPLTKKSFTKYDESLIDIIVRLEEQLKSKEALLSQIEDPALLEKLLALREQLIKENPTRAKELGLL